MTVPIGLRYAVRQQSVRPAPGRRSPLLLMLHGRFEDERDLLPLANVMDGSFLVASARAPFPQLLRVGCLGDRCRLERGRGFAWFTPNNHLFLGQGDQVNNDEVRASTSALIYLIDDIIAKYGVDKDRVFLLGFSQGAIMSEGLLVCYPDRIAGAAAFSGRLLPIFKNCAVRSRGRAAILFHGTNDPIVPIAEGKAAAQFLSANGIDVTWREFSGGHTVPRVAIEQASDWLSSQLETS